jgi:hypothetical protein
MTAEPDDEGLTWGGETDPTHVESPVVELPNDDEQTDAAEPGISSGLLVTYGAFGAIFILYLVGWLIAIQSAPAGLSGPLAAVMDRIGQFLAFLSPALWFFGVFLLAPELRVRTRIIWLAVGVVILAPWPFVLGY